MNKGAVTLMIILPYIIIKLKSFMHNYRQILNNYFIWYFLRRKYYIWYCIKIQ
jgi:hypothetical protein